LKKKLLYCAASLLLSAMSVSADQLVLENGKSLKIKEYYVEGGNIHVALSERSEMVIPVAWVREIRDTPDPPEPVAEQAQIPSDDSSSSGLAFAQTVRELATKHQVDWRLVTAVMATESNFNPRAISSKGARGLMQLMPGTAKLYRVANIDDPTENIEAGVQYLKMLLERYKGKLEWALAAYNSGPGKVDHYRGIPPYTETRDYVKRVLKFYKKLASI
jgi:soluble lytic murein transglycosylase-like protein